MSTERCGRREDATLEGETDRAFEETASCTFLAGVPGPIWLDISDPFDEVRARWIDDGCASNATFCILLSFELVLALWPMLDLPFRSMAENKAAVTNNFRKRTNQLSNMQ